MSLSVLLGWKVFYRLPAEQKYSVGEKNPIFDVRTGKSLLAEIGGNMNSEFFPLALEPRSAFFSKLASALRGLDLSVTKTTFEAPLEHGFLVKSETLKGKFSIHVLGGEVCITIACAPIGVVEATDFQLLRHLSFFPSLLELSKRIFELVEARGGKLKPITGDLKAFPSIQIVASTDSPGLDQSELTQIVTGHAKVTDAIVEDVFSKNRNHQIDGTTVLLDRQGVLCYVHPKAHPDEKTGNDRRYRSCTAILELAAIAERVIRDEGIDAFNSLLPLVNTPRLAIPYSTSALRSWELMISEFHLITAVNNQKKSGIPVATKLKSDDQPATKGSNLNVLCVAAATVELSASCKHLQSIFGNHKKTRLDDGREYALRYIDTKNGVTWSLVSLSFQGQLDAAVDVKNLAVLLKPDLIFMVGMCMSMPEKALPVGTVIIPNEVMVFDHERHTTEGVQHRPHGDRVDNGLFKLARLVAASTQCEYKVITDKGLASATAKVESISSDLISFIKTSFPDAAAYDMEGWGFYRAGAGQQCLWIKAVADAGESQSPNFSQQENKHSVQEQATVNAIKFAVRLVEEFVECTTDS